MSYDYDPQSKLEYDEMIRWEWEWEALRVVPMMNAGNLPPIAVELTLFYLCRIVVDLFPDNGNNLNIQMFLLEMKLCPRRIFLPSHFASIHH
jgi:hypothetical protein